jgi:hypothetical protein
VQRLQRLLDTRVMVGEIIGFILAILFMLGIAAFFVLNILLISGFIEAVI